MARTRLKTLNTNAFTVYTARVMLSLPWVLFALFNFFYWKDGRVVGLQKEESFCIKAFGGMDR